MTRLGTGGPDRLDGSSDSDALLGVAGHDTINGGAGNDSLDGGTGNDIITGGDGADAMSGGTGHDSLDGGESSDVLFGGTGNDTMSGGDGADYLYAGIEGDFLATNWGADRFDGGNGLDTAVVFRAQATAAIRFDLRTPSVTQTLDNGTTLVNIEQVTLFTGSGHDSLQGGDYADTFVSALGNDSLYGWGGNDYLHAGAGNDLLHGGAGRDYLDAAEGNDTLYGEAGDERIDGGDGRDIGYLGLVTTGNVTFSVATNLTEGVMIGATEIRNLEQVSITTGAGNDTLIGGTYGDTLHGGNGRNALDGGAGEDVLTGGIHQDLLTGGSGHDTITAGAGNDTIRGDSGEDLLTGGAGDDLIDGGAGIDTAVYSGNITDYYAWRVDAGIVLRDLRANGDGSDTLVLVDRLAFADGTVTMAHMLSRGRAPVAQLDTLTLSEDSHGKVNVLANDRDDDGDTLSVVSVTSADPNLSFAWTKAGLVTVTPGAAYQSLGAGQSAIRNADVVIRDPYGNTSHSTLAVTITGSNDAPTAVNDAYTIGEDAPLLQFDVTGNDLDPDAGTDLFVTGVSYGTTFGTVTLNDNGTLSYDPGRAFQYLMAGETATDSFSYTVADGAGGQSTATVNITIVGADERPLAGWDLLAY